MTQEKRFVVKVQANKGKEKVGVVILEVQATSMANAERAVLMMLDNETESTITTWVEAR